MPSEYLRALRKELGLSVTEAAAQVHVSSRTWGRWEAGTRHIPEAIIHLFCTLNSLPYGSGENPVKANRA